MRHTWRWFGPVDKVTIADARQAGAQGIVTALHHVPYGAVWPTDEIEKRKREVAHLPSGEPSGLGWEVVESLPVSEAVKTQSGDFREHIANYKTSLENLAAAGLFTICYNFMPVLDWTRTDLAWRVAHGGTTMRFDLIDFAVFDIQILRRRGAASDYPTDTVAEADRRFEAMDEPARERLARTVNAGLPGSVVPSLEALKAQSDRYAGIDSERLRQNFIDFLSEVTLVA